MALLRDTVVAGNLNVSNKIITQELNTTGKIWVQNASNRLTTTSGMPGNMLYGSGNTGTQIYSNGIAFVDPINSGNNDAGWLRFIETTTDSGYFEIASGDGGIELIVVRLYNTNNNIARQMILLDTDGVTKISTKTDNDNYAYAAMQIREENFNGAGSDTWGRAPRLTWHWSGRTAALIGLSSNGWLYESPGTTTNFSRIVIENGGSWNIVVPWANTNHPSTFPPSVHNFTCTLLWTNSNVGSSFAAQTVYLSLSAANFKLLLMSIRHSTGTANYQMCIVNPDGNGGKISNAGYSDNGVRTVTVSGTSVAFTVAQHGSSSTANTYCIPYKIWGLA